ncbi:MAG: hypothetical protein LBH38_04095 [Holosporales bacterium]|jgi:hypothetical protein|nr:hypothetical protein [Holosporales bacterium]
MRKDVMISAATALIGVCFASAQEENIIAASEPTAPVEVMNTKHACFFHGPFVGLSAGFANAKWDGKPVAAGTKFDITKNGVGVALNVGYIHALHNGFSIGVEGRGDFFPSLEGKKDPYEVKLDTPGKFAGSGDLLMGYNCPQIKGCVGIMAGGTYFKSKVTNKTEKKDATFAQFAPEGGVFYVAKIHKNIGLGLYGLYGFGLKDKQKIGTEEFNLTTPRIAAGARVYYNF